MRETKSESRSVRRPRMVIEVVLWAVFGLNCFIVLAGWFLEAVGPMVLEEEYEAIPGDRIAESVYAALFGLSALMSRRWRLEQAMPMAAEATRESSGGVPQVDGRVKFYVLEWVKMGSLIKPGTFFFMLFIAYLPAEVGIRGLRILLSLGERDFGVRIFVLGAVCLLALIWALVFLLTLFFSKSLTERYRQWNAE